MKRQTPFLKHVTSLTIANTTDKEIRTNLFAPDVNGLENKYVRDDLSSTKVDYKQIQNHIARVDELVTTVRFQVLNPKHDRLLFQTEGNEVINANNIHGAALRSMDVIEKDINGSWINTPIINSDWHEESSIMKDFNFEFIASKNTLLRIKIPPYTAYQIDFLRDSSLYLTMIKDIAPLNIDIYNALRDGFVLFNKLSEIVPITIDNSIPSKDNWLQVKNKEQYIFKLLSDISQHIEINKVNSDIITLYNSVKEVRFLINELLNITKKLIASDKENSYLLKQKQEDSFANKPLHNKNKKTKSLGKFLNEVDDVLNDYMVKKATKKAKNKTTKATNKPKTKITKKVIKKTNVIKKKLDNSLDLPKSKNKRIKHQSW